jgi:tetratricopeptide (TPR) repeat protein
MNWNVLSVAQVTVMLVAALGQTQTPQGWDDSQRSDQRLNAGMSASEHRDYRKTIELLSPLAAVFSEPQDTAAITALGFSYYFAGLYEKALVHLKRAANQDPDNVEIAYALGLWALRLRRGSEARTAFAQMFHVAPESPKARLLTAKFMLSEQLEALAEDELRNALEQEPDLPQVHYLLGELAIFRSDLGKGIELLEKELAIDPANSFAHYRLGDAYDRKGLLDRAVGALRKAIWLNPDFSSPYILLGKVYFKKNMTATAEEILQRSLAIDPNNASGHYLLGTIYQKAGKTALAAKEFDLCLKLQK